VTHEATG